MAPKSKDRLGFVVVVLLCWRNEPIAEDRMSSEGARFIKNEKSEKK